MKLTSAAKVELPEGKRDYITFDQTLRGFGLRVRLLAGGVIRRYWIVQYRAHGHARRMIVGDAEKVTAAQAREQARKLLSKVELGGDPQADKRERRDKDAVNLRSVVKDYLDSKTADVKPNTMRMLKTYLDRSTYLGPLQTMAIDRITRKDVAARVIAISKSGASTAIAFHTALSTMFSWAMEMGLVEHNPVVGAFKPERRPSRDRVLSDAELRAIWKGVEDDEYGKIIKLLICTGCRREEIAGMRESEFDDNGTWTLPATRSKNGRPHTLPVTPLMQKVIDSIPKRDRDLLFGRKHGFTSWSIGKPALDEKLGLPHWTVHDIRRSVATGMANIGVQPHVVEAALNHQSGTKRGVAGTYNRSPYEREVRAALALWSDHVRTVVEGGKRKLVAIEQRAAATTQ